mmetsp:Transcript_16500/g.40412  ORF Transcript_16500/g.40412 Transcript_16500/m.40412 type:complete len:230 (-) Transcript_16500:297-986(-)
MLNLPFLVSDTSPTSTRPLPRRLMMSPDSTCVLVLAPSRQFTLTCPLSMRSAILDRLILNPALATASSLMDASTDEKVSTRATGTRSSLSGEGTARTGTLRTLVNVVLKNRAISGVVRICAPFSPCTRMSPNLSRSMPDPTAAPRKSRWSALSNRKLPSICSSATMPPLSQSPAALAKPSSLSNTSGRPMTSRTRSARSKPPHARASTSAMRPTHIRHASASAGSRNSV